ncbi:MAG TPA: ABC transporter permease [Thermomicrobiales bacterium]|nr:ABC transporter permease [Thermomicrobiales bacterium]
MAEQPVSLATLPLEQQRERGEHHRPRRSLPHVRIHHQTIRQVVPLALFLILVLAGPFVIPMSPTAQDLAGRLQPPVWLSGGSWDHPLGTDGLGRDLLARIAVGGRASLVVSVVAALGAGAIGVVLGILSGMLGGIVDRAITMVVETLLAVPFITIGIVVTATVGQSATNLVLLLIFSGWITHARIVRLQVQSLVRSEFILAALAMGAGRWHIAIRHLLPNLAPVIVVVLCQQAGSMLLWSASLTYLGIGMPVGTITLGGIVREGQDLIYNAWWVSVMGGLAIALAVAGFNLFADWVQRRIDPTLR